ncbi:hypothetical protein J3R83DRAFT_5545 [Lanmaoa asiatica]|nr:hypothetical protein J3R83DRAFT_5545 [Lanmaoa asiatica]
MPTPVHEFAITNFSRAVQPVLESLPINRQRLRIALEPNLSLRSTLTGFLATPDLALVATSTGGGSSSRNVFAVVECAFSQDHGNLMKKIQEEVEGWPEIALVVAIFVSEVRNYKSPPADSPTWDYFAQHESVLSSNHFLSLPPSIDKSATSALVEYSSDTAHHSPSAVSDGSDSDSDHEPEPLVLGPITIAGHTWCEIRDVQYHVWVKEDGVLDLDRDSTIGFLYPEIAMGDAELVINNGLSAVKSEIVELAAKTTKSRSTLRKLRDAELRVKFDWGAIQSAVKMAAEQTGASRYETWFYQSFRGTKRSHPDDESYGSSESQSGSSVTSLESLDPAQPRYMLRRRAERDGIDS